MKNTISINLRKEWDRYRELKPHMTQSVISKKLGYSQSVFGKMLNGSLSFTTEMVIKLANELEIPPTRLNNDFRHSNFGEYSVHRTSTGYPVPARVKLHKTIAHGRFVVWNDSNMPIERGSDFEDYPKSAVQSGFIPNTTIISVPADVVTFNDPNFPMSSPPIYLIVPKEGKIRAIATKIKPSNEEGDVYRVTGILLV